MRIFHVSDLHGDLGVFGQDPTDVPDLWVFTGDMMPNRTRGNSAIEVPYQMQWYASVYDWWVPRLRGAPVLLVPGNHDYADLALLLRRDGVDAREVTPEGLVFQGLRFSGFGHIPLIAGEWNRESTYRELSDLTTRAIASDPDVLVTHAPPDGILNGFYAGVGALTAALTYGGHRVRAHLFGHAHEDGGRSIQNMGVLFVNSATTLQVVRVLPPAVPADGPQRR